MNISVPLSFVIPVRNDAVHLRECLKSIHNACAECSEIEILVIDNGSTDDSVAVARKGGATLLSIPNARVSELRNRGAAAARGTVLAFIDSDHEIAAGWGSCALESLAVTSIGAVGALCWPPQRPTWVQRVYDGLREHREGAHDVQWLGSGNLAVKRDAFLAVGGFDARLDVCEDVDLCRKLRSAGYRLVADSRLRSIHKGDPPTLGALFRAELWRGRDNLRVSMRGPLTWSELPSIVIPVADFACLAGASVALLMFGRRGVPAAIFGITVVSALSLLRSIRIYRRLAPRRTLDLMKAFLVAAVYDAARALALALPVSHRRSKA